MRRKTGKSVGTIVAIVLWIGGLSLLLYPDIKREWIQVEWKADIDRFQQERKYATDAVYQKISAYNQRIYDEKQKDLKDAWSYSQPLFSKELQKLQTDIFGYIEIPRLAIKIPLYIGADTRHLNMGAAILAQTSMPIGGVNSNCVIAAHRGGITGEALFRDIEKLKVNDEIYITNPWDTLTYVVRETIVIQPEDIDAVKIQEQHDLVTLITCHPYPSSERRYLVFCERKGSSFHAIQVQETVDQPSQERIDKEQAIRYACVLCVCIITCFMIIRFFVSRLRK